VAQQQKLIPAPYPEQYGNTSIRSPTYRLKPHQDLLRDPAPQALGPTALGNPRPYRLQRHQRLLPTPYPRQYHIYPR
jgi:hypothetical protein